MRKVAICWLLLLPQLLPACDCLVARSVCQEVVASELVFIGRVESIEPRIPNKGARVHFKVLTLFKNKQDDDSDSGDKKKDDRKTAKLDFVDLWDQSEDCGIRFQQGESYLVYSNDDEQTGRWETDVCYRTSRLSDAGEDLAYLYFFQNGGPNALRLEGFVTSKINQLIQDRFRYSGKVESPVSNVVVELRSNHVIRDIEPDSYGRFVFDGLAEGDYQVSVFKSGFPELVQKLSGPKPVHLSAGRCDTTALFVVSRGTGKKPE